MINFLHLQSISTCLTFLSLQFERKYPDENSYSVLIRGGGGGVSLNRMIYGCSTTLCSAGSWAVISRGNVTITLRDFTFLYLETMKCHINDNRHNSFHRSKHT